MSRVTPRVKENGKRVKPRDLRPDGSLKAGARKGKANRYRDTTQSPRGGVVLPTRESRKQSRKNRHAAYKLFAKGWSTSEVREELDISVHMSQVYLRGYRLSLQRRVTENPDFFDKVLSHTFEELQILKDQAKLLTDLISEHRPQGKLGDEEYEPGSPGVVISAMAQLHRNNEQRQRMKRLLDQRIEVTTKVEMARARQNRILQFMEQHLCTRCSQILANKFEKEFNEMVDAGVMTGTRGRPGITKTPVHE